MKSNTLTVLAVTADGLPLNMCIVSVPDAASAGNFTHTTVLAVPAPLVNATGHDDDAALPCLCKHCLERAGDTAEAAVLPFKRSFAITGTRVLHFWAPAELGRVPVRRSVTEALAKRLTRRRGGK